MPSLAKIRSKVSAEIRTLLDYLWQEFLRTEQWPLDRAIYSRLPKPRLDKLLARLNGSYLVQYDSNGSKTYQLQPYGVLCTTDGEAYVDLLKRYIGHVQHVYFEHHNQNSVKHDEVRAALDLSEADTVLLGRLLGAGIFWTQPGHAPAYATWEAALPKNLGDLFEKIGSIEPGFQKLLDQHWHPGMKISAEERAQQLYAGSQSLELLFDPRLGGATPPRRRVRKRVTIPAAVETEVLTKSRRRCCVCFGLYGELETKPGQIAHVDGDRTNAAPDNLAWLCLAHHDQLDTKISQSKGLTASEVKSFRTELWQAIECNAHVNGRDHHDGADSPGQATPYDAIIASAPRDAVEAAWRDVEHVTRGAFAGKMNFADPCAPVPAGVMALLLRTQANVDQEHAALFQQLSEVHQLIANGEPCDQPVARKFCVKAVQLIAYLGKK